MVQVRLAFLWFGLTLATPATANPAHSWADHIAGASQRFGIPEAWIRRVMDAESGGRTVLHGRPIESRAGAMGLMQLMPGTWRELRVAYGLGPDPHDPRDNIIAGAAYLRAMYDRFGYPGLFGAYNAGPARYAEHLATGRRLPAETIAYMGQVGDGVTMPAQPGAPPLLFVALSGAQSPSILSAASSPPGASSLLFVQLRGAGSR